MAKRIEIENRSSDRSRWALEVEGAEDIILGDPADRAIAHDQRTKLTSDPKVIVSAEVFAKIKPHSKRLIDALVKRGDVEIRELSA